MIPAPMEFYALLPCPVLLPVELVRNQRTSTYDLRLRDEDLLTNLPLAQRLKEDFGIDFPEVEVGEGWKPSTYFDQVQRVVASRHGWKIDPDAIQLGFFSFSKLLMYLDLAIEAWPEGGLGTHALTKGLLYEGFECETPLFSPGDRLDVILPPEKIFHVVDADASQARVIEEVRSGRNLVVQGPPGTGKSQTITNIIAAAAREGKRVLFVAEKMAALSVVHDRLVKVGLRDICLELHSRSANKKVVLAELARTIMAAQAGPSTPVAPVELKAARDHLNNIADALHETIGTSGETPYSVLSRQARFIGRGAQPPQLSAQGLVDMGRAEEDAIVVVLGEYAEILTQEGEDPHPFEGTRNLGLQPVDLARLSSVLQDASQQAAELAEALRKAQDAVATQLPISAPSGVRVLDLLIRLRGMPAGSAQIAQHILGVSDGTRLVQDLAAGSKWRDAYDSAATTFTEAALQAPPPATRAALLAGSTSFFARWGRAYRQASRELAALLNGPIPGAAAERVGLVDQLFKLASLRREWEDDWDFCSRALGDEWRSERTDFGRLNTVAEWCQGVRGSELATAAQQIIDLAANAEELERLEAGLDAALAGFRKVVDEALRLLDLDPASLPGGSTEAADLDALSIKFATMARSSERYTTWAQLARLRRKVEQQGLGELIDRMAAAAEPEQRMVAPSFVRVARPPVERAELYRRPSSRGGHAEYRVVERVKLGPRIPITGSPDMRMLGEAMHAIVAADRGDEPHDARLERAQAILGRWGVHQIAATDAVGTCDRLWSEAAKRWPAATLQRECPVAAHIGDQLVRGRIDLLVERAEGFAIVDHKSFPGASDSWEARAIVHGAQLDLYAEALARARLGTASELWVHMPIVGALLRIERVGEAG